MSNWSSLLFVIGAAAMVWLGLQMIRRHPGAFNKESLGKSFYTIGWLTLMIIGVVAICVILLRST